MHSLFATVDELVSSYADYLAVVCEANLQPFKQRLKDDREAAVAEAVVFGIPEAKSLRKPSTDQREPAGSRSAPARL
jgi:hypothetical protein